MALTLARGPRAGPETIAEAVRNLGTTALAAVIDEDAPRFIRRDMEVLASKPVALYHAARGDLEEIVAVRALRRVGWRYLLIQGDRPWLADLVTTRAGPRFAELVGGDPAERFADACRFIDQVEGLEGEVRVLRAATYGRDALWIRGPNSDAFVDLRGDGQPALTGIEYIASLRHQFDVP